MIFNKKKIKEYDTRIVKRFALLPKRLNDNQIVWLQFYMEEQIYLINPIIPFFKGWEVKERWV